MSEKVMENNRVSVIGTIVSDFTFSHAVFGEGFYLLDLSVNRLSEQADIIPLMISERLIDVTKDYKGCTIEALSLIHIFLLRRSKVRMPWYRRSRVQICLHHRRMVHILLRLPMYRRKQIRRFRRDSLRSRFWRERQEQFITAITFRRDTAMRRNIQWS